MKKPIKLPKFKNEDEEREFWDKFDLSEYATAKDFVRVSFPNLKPTLTKEPDEMKAWREMQEALRPFRCQSGEELVSEELIRERQKEARREGF